MRLIEVNVLAGEQLIGQGYNTKRHWIRPDNVQLVVPAGEPDRPLSVIVLSSNVGKVAEVVVVEPAEDLAKRVAGGDNISPAPPVSVQLVQPSLLIKPGVHV